MGALQGGLTGNRAANIMLYRLAGKVMESARKHVTAEAARITIEAQGEADIVAGATAGADLAQAVLVLCVRLSSRWHGLESR